MMATGERVGAEVFDLGEREQVCVQVVECEGRPMVTVRLRVFDEDAGKWVPRRGLTLPAEVAGVVGQAMVEAGRLAEAKLRCKERVR